MLRSGIRNLLLCILIGCAVGVRANTTAHRTNWLQDYDRLGHVGGVPLEQVYIMPEFDIRNYRILYIPPVQIDPLAYRRHGEPDRQKAQRLAAELRARVEQEIRGLQIFEFVSTDPYFMTVRDQALTLQLRITEFNSGDARKRIAIGFGAGATEVQLEGKLFEHKLCRTMVEFADRRLHAGSVILWGTRATSDSEFLIGVDLKQILRGISKLFIFMREEGPPAYQR